MDCVILPEQTKWPYSRDAHVTAPRSGRMPFSGNRIHGSFDSCGMYDSCDSFGNSGMNCSSDLVGPVCQIAIC
tara:strand:+ start:629 stop:847 length:219 start_codon:yes stop_codon:yes gene_type:complete